MSDTTENTENISVRTVFRRMVGEMPISETPSVYFKMPNSFSSGKRRTLARASVSKTLTNVTLDVTPKTSLRRVLREKKARRSSLPDYIPSRKTENGTRSTHKSKRFSKWLLGLLPGESSNSTENDFAGVSEHNATFAQAEPRRSLRNKITLKGFQPPLQMSVGKKKTRRKTRPRSTVEDFASALDRKRDEINLQADATLNPRSGKKKKTRHRITVEDFASALDQKQDGRNEEADVTLNSPSGKKKKRGKGARRQMTLDEFVNALDLQKSRRNDQDKETVDAINVLQAVNSCAENPDLEMEVDHHSVSEKQKENVKKGRPKSLASSKKRAKDSSLISSSESKKQNDENRSPMRSTSLVNVSRRRRQSSSVVEDEISTPLRTRMQLRQKKHTEETPVNSPRRPVAGSPVNVSSSNKTGELSSVKATVVSEEIHSKPTPANSRILKKSVKISSNRRQTFRGIGDEILFSPVNTRKRPEGTPVNSHSTRKSVVASPVNISLNSRRSSNKKAPVVESEASPLNTKMQSMQKRTEGTPGNRNSARMLRVSSPVNISKNSRHASRSNMGVPIDEIVASPVSTRISSSQEHRERTPLNGHSARKFRVASPVNISTNSRQANNMEVPVDVILASPVNARMQSMLKQTQGTPENTNSPRMSKVASPVNVSMNSNMGVHLNDIVPSPVNKRMQLPKCTEGTPANEPTDSPTKSVVASPVNISLNRTREPIDLDEIVASPANARMQSGQKRQSRSPAMNTLNKADGLRHSSTVSLPRPTSAFLPSDHLTNLPSTSGYKPGQKNPQILNDWQRLVTPPQETPLISALEEDALDVSKKKKPEIPSNKQTSRKRRTPDVGLGNQTRALFQHFSGIPVEKDALPLVEEVTEMFLKNVVIDLEAYTRHAKRKIVQPADVVLLMKRQKFITKNHSLQFLAAKYLPMKHREEIIPCVAANGKIVP